MADTDPNAPATSATGANTGNIVALPTTKDETRPSDKVIGFVKRHPVLTTAGGVAVGVAVAALLPRRMTRPVTSKAIRLAETASASTVLFGKRAGTRMKQLGKSAGEEAIDAYDVVEAKAEQASDYAAGKLEKLASAALAAATTFAQLGRKQAEKVGDVASEGSHKIADFAGDLRKQVKH